MALREADLRARTQDDVPTPPYSEEEEGEEEDQTDMTPSFDQAEGEDEARDDQTYMAPNDPEGINA